MTGTLEPTITPFHDYLLNTLFNYIRFQVFQRREGGSEKFHRGWI